MDLGPTPPYRPAPPAPPPIPWPTPPPYAVVPAGTPPLPKLPPCYHGKQCPVWQEAQLDPEALAWLRGQPGYVPPEHRVPPKKRMRPRTRAALYTVLWLAIALFLGTGAVNGLTTPGMAAYGVFWLVVLAGSFGSWLWYLGVRHGRDD